MQANQIRLMGQSLKSRDPWLASARSFLRAEPLRAGGQITFDDGTHALAGRDRPRPEDKKLNVRA